MSGARDAILARIRAANGAAPVPQPAAPADWRREDSRGRDEILAEFRQKLRDYGVTVLDAATADVPAAVAKALAARGATTVAVPDDLPHEWLPAGLSAQRERGLDTKGLDGVDGVLSGCALAIAQTGTIVLDGGARQGRRAATLLPDYHLCVVEAEQVVGIVPEAIARLAPRVAEGAPITFISGPSATADIELERVVGVHGPRTLEVIIVSDTL